MGRRAPGIRLQKLDRISLPRLLKAKELVMANDNLRPRRGSAYVTAFSMLLMISSVAYAQSGNGCTPSFPTCGANITEGHQCGSGGVVEISYSGPGYLYAC